MDYENNPDWEQTGECFFHDADGILRCAKSFMNINTLEVVTVNEAVED